MFIALDKGIKSVLNTIVNDSMVKNPEEPKQQRNVNKKLICIITLTVGDNPVPFDLSSVHGFSNINNKCIVKRKSQGKRQGLNLHIQSVKTPDDVTKWCYPLHDDLGNHLKYTHLHF